MWGGLFWWIPSVYLFFGPYQRNAGWVEWTLTSLAFLTGTGLYTTALIYNSRKLVLRRVCIAVALLGIAFTAYRFEGAIFLALVAAFGPFTVDGNIPRSAIIVVLASIIPSLEWWLLGSGPNAFPLVIGIESLLVGAGATFATRQALQTKRINKSTERERIARDLHDILGHTLSVIILKSELAGRLVDRDPTRAGAEIADVERISRKALAEVREAILGYHEGDLRAEIERATSTLATAGIEVEKRCEQLEMPLSQERVLAMVLREAVTNIVRHSQAKHCRIMLQLANGACRLTVGDDGRGGAHTEGLGMRGIRERVQAIGGSACWNTESGTELTITIPAVAGISNSS